MDHCHPTASVLEWGTLRAFVGRAVVMHLPRSGHGTFQYLNTRDEGGHAIVFLRAVAVSGSRLGP